MIDKYYLYLDIKLAVHSVPYFSFHPEKNKEIERTQEENKGYIEEGRKRQKKISQFNELLDCARTIYDLFSINNYLLCFKVIT